MKNTLFDTILGVLGLLCALGLLVCLPLTLIASFDSAPGCAELFGGAMTTCALGAVVFLGLHFRFELLGLCLKRRPEARSAPTIAFEPAPRLSVREHDKARRCAYCHEDFAEADIAHPCSGCRTWVHRDCWREALLCPSLGCRNARLRSRP